MNQSDSSRSSLKAVPQGTAHGFLASAAFPLTTLRRGGGQGLRVAIGRQGFSPSREFVQEWLFAGSRLPIRLFSVDGGYEVEAGDLGIYRISLAEPSVELPPDLEPVIAEAFLWSTPTAICAAAAGDLMLHAAAVDVDGRAIIFTGDGGDGKTTLGAGFHRAGHRLLSDDTVRVSLVESRPQIFPGPALLRLRNDMSAKLALRDMVKVWLGTEKTYLAVEEHRRGTGAPLPIAAVVMLEWGDYVFSPLVAPIEKGLAALWPRSFYLPGERSRELVFQTLVGLLDTIPVYRMSRPRQLASLDWAVAALGSIEA